MSNIALSWGKPPVHFGPEDQIKGLKLGFSGIRHGLSQWGYTLPANDHISHHTNHINKRRKKNKLSTQWGGDSKSKWCSFCGGVFKRFGVGIFGFGPTRPIRLTPGGAWFKVSLSGARIWIHTTLPQEFGQNGSFLVDVTDVPFWMGKYGDTVEVVLNGWNTAWGFWMGWMMDRSVFF